MRNTGCVFAGRQARASACVRTCTVVQVCRRPYTRRSYSASGCKTVLGGQENGHGIFPYSRARLGIAIMPVCSYFNNAVFPMLSRGQQFILPTARVKAPPHACLPADTFTYTHADACTHVNTHEYTRSHAHTQTYNTCFALYECGGTGGNLLNIRHKL